MNLPFHNRAHLRLGLVIKAPPLIAGRTLPISMRPRRHDGAPHNRAATRRTAAPRHPARRRTAATRPSMPCGSAGEFPTDPQGVDKPSPHSWPPDCTGSRITRGSSPFMGRRIMAAWTNMGGGAGRARAHSFSAPHAGPPTAATARSRHSRGAPRVRPPAAQRSWRPRRRQ